MALSTLYTAPQRFGEMLERGKDNTISQDVLTPNGDPVTITSATVTVRDSGGNEIVSAASATVSGGTMSYTVAAASLSTSLAFDPNWEIRWFTVIGGETFRFDKDAALVARRLYPVIRDSDIVGRGDATNGGDYSLVRILQDRAGQGFRAEREDAWYELLRNLLADQRWPALILSSFALFDAHKYLAKRMVYQNAKTALPNSGWEQAAADAHALYQQKWAEINFVYDSAGDGNVSDNPDGRVVRRKFLNLGGPSRLPNQGSGYAYNRGGQW